MEGFLKGTGGYRSLTAYKICEAIYDITFCFTERFLSKGDRTVDQMVQAARSGKQNIAEGSKAAMTSRETEIKLTNVAKASLEELLIDYEDYLRVRNLEHWDARHRRAVRLKTYVRSQEFFGNFRSLLPRLNAVEMANMAMTLICQAQFLLDRLLTKQQEQFLREGGIREQMMRARLDYRNRQR